MRLNKILLSTGAAALLSLGSCVGDLDLKPTDPSLMTPDQFANDPEAYLDGTMAGIYQQFVTYGANGDASVQGFDGGMSTFQRAMFILEEVPTDEASWIPNDADYGLFQYGVIPANNTVIMGVYSRLYINIALCNQFITTIRDGYFNLKTDAQKALADEYVRQARILRAACYFYAIDCFGNVPYADENVKLGEIAPQLSTDFAEGRRLVYEKVVGDLEDIVTWYKTNDPNNRPAYGYVGLDVAESLLVKFYLNAGVYTGTPAWDKCYAHAKAVIGRLGHGGFENSGLCQAYLQNFAANNNKFTINGTANPVNEIIWTLPQETNNDDGQGILSYANGTFMCNAWIGNSGEADEFKCNNADYNSGNGWKCIVARRQFVEKFDWNADFSQSPDKRVALWKTAKDGFNVNNISLSQSDWGQNGFLAVKYNNWYIDDNGDIDKAQSPAASDQLGVDYAAIRLAEIYLSAAEATLQGGGGNPAEALGYVNLIRRRAGLTNIPSLDLAQLQDERCRELYTENIRRSDLIRYGKWISGYTWSWKNNVENGADFSASFNVYPIPSTTAARNGYTQNPGY